MMKKSYLTLAAMAMIMASCSNEVLIDNEDGQTDVAIGFSTFSDKATKATTDPENLEKYHESFTVYGTKKNGSEIQKVFNAVNTNFIADAANRDATGEWRYYPARYWDKKAFYKFIAVAPDNTIVNYIVGDGDEVGNSTFTTVSGGYTLKGQNLQSTPTTGEIKTGFNGSDNNDTDILTSELVEQSGALHTANTPVQLTFKHILSKLNVSIKKASNLDGSKVTIKSVTIKGLKDKGDYKESKYNSSSSVSGWTASYSVEDPDSRTYKLSYSGAQDLNESNGNPYFFIESLVMPQTIADNLCELEIKYTIESTYDINEDGDTNDEGEEYSENFTYTLDLYDVAILRSMLDRNNYTLKFVIETDVITFDANASVWADNENSDIKIDSNK